MEAPFPEFEAPPANPMEVLRNWLERARRYGVRVPASCAAPPWGSPAAPRTPGKGLRWSERSQQLVLSGCDERLTDERADAQWLSRPYQT
ncbi:phenazine biosynthesis protein, partial [Pseudomonas aeruginosa]